MYRFGLIGDGTIATRHKEAIKHVGGELAWISDPAFLPRVEEIIGVKHLLGFKGIFSPDGALLTANAPSSMMYGDVDYVVVCSPTQFHRQHTKEALKHGCDVICEKPLCLPWEPLIDDDRVNVCLQLRYIEGLPKKADLVRAVMVRDEAFFKTWKGDPRQAGGNLYEFYIHYIDLAILLDAAFEGEVLSEGKQIREIIYNGLFPGKAIDITNNEEISWSRQTPFEGRIDIMSLDMQNLYNKMYEDIVNDGGIKPRDIFYLKYVLDQTSIKYGFMCKEKIVLPKGLL